MPHSSLDQLESDLINQSVAILDLVSSPGLKMLRSQGMLLRCAESVVLSLIRERTELSDEEQKRCVSEYLKSKDIKNQDELAGHLEANFISEDEMISISTTKACLELFAASHFSEQVEREFLEKKEALDLIEYSLIRVQDEDLCNEIYHQITEDNVSFRELSNRYGEGPESSNSGMIGPVPINKAHPELASRLRTSPVNTVSRPFKVDKWWLIARVNAVKPATLDPETTSLIQRDLTARWLRIILPKIVSKVV